MDKALLIELFGYLGSALVVVSMLMASVVKLRVINMIGSVISGTYALIIGSFPLALMNGCLIVINAYNLIKLLKTKQEYDVISCSAQEASVEYFVRRYLQDIRRYFPDFGNNTEGLDAAYMVFCNGGPAGILLGRKKGGSEIEVELDYAVPAYRDCSVGNYLYSKLPAMGIDTLSTLRSDSAAHMSYLNKMGFELSGDSYIKILK